MISATPIQRAFFNKEFSSRNTIDVVMSPKTGLTPEQQLIMDIGIHSTVTDNSVLPDDMQKLLISTIFQSYRFYEYSEDPTCAYKVIVVAEEQKQRILLYVLQPSRNKLSIKVLNIKQTEEIPEAIDTALSPEDYVIAAGRCTNKETIQYNELLSDTYKLLFSVVYSTAIDEYPVLEEVVEDLKLLFKDTEISLHLDITNSVNLLGFIDSGNNMHLNVRQIGTPDTYWTRTVNLASYLND